MQSPLSLAYHVLPLCWNIPSNIQICFKIIHLKLPFVYQCPLSSHCSILLLPFSRKPFEQMFCSHCLYFLTLRFLFNSLESGFCLWYSTETALVKITVTSIVIKHNSILFCLLASFDVIGPNPSWNTSFSWLPFIIHLGYYLFNALLFT